VVPDAETMFRVVVEPPPVETSPVAIASRPKTGDDRPAQEGGAERFASLLLGHGREVGALRSPFPKRP